MLIRLRSVLYFGVSSILKINGWQGHVREHGGKMTQFPKKSIDDWRELATRECKGRSADELTWNTPEGIAADWIGG